MFRKKSHPKFNVPNYGAKKRKKVKPRWRKQRGIDNKKRIKKAFMGAEPTIGYGNPENMRGVRRNGKRIVLVHSMSELKRVMENPDTASGFDVTIAHPVSKRVRAQMAKVAGEQGIQITNSVKKNEH